MRAASSLVGVRHLRCKRRADEYRTETACTAARPVAAGCLTSTAPDASA